MKKLLDESNLYCEGLFLESKVIFSQLERKNNVKKHFYSLKHFI